jgi:hypothetical protein
MLDAHVPRVDFKFLIRSCSALFMGPCFCRLSTKFMRTCALTTSWPAVQAFHPGLPSEIYILKGTVEELHFTSHTEQQVSTWSHLTPTGFTQRSCQHYRPLKALWRKVLKPCDFKGVIKDQPRLISMFLNAFLRSSKVSPGRAGERTVALLLLSPCSNGQTHGRLNQELVTFEINCSCIASVIRQYRQSAGIALTSNLAFI